MSEEKLICGCGGEIEINCWKTGKLGMDAYKWSISCINCHINIVGLRTKAEAISIFKLATRADVKQGINWISVKDGLPKEEGWYLKFFDDGTITSGWCIKEASVNWKNRGITHWAEINLPEK